MMVTRLQLFRLSLSAILWDGRSVLVEKVRLRSASVLRIAGIDPRQQRVPIFSTLSHGILR